MFGLRSVWVGAVIENLFGFLSICLTLTIAFLFLFAKIEVELGVFVFRTGFGRKEVSGALGNHRFASIWCQVGVAFLSADKIGTSHEVLLTRIALKSVNVDSWWLSRVLSAVGSSQKVSIFSTGIVLLLRDYSCHLVKSELSTASLDIGLRTRYV